MESVSSFGDKVAQKSIEKSYENSYTAEKLRNLASQQKNALIEHQGKIKMLQKSSEDIQRKVVSLAEGINTAKGLKIAQENEKNRNNESFATALRSEKQRGDILKKAQEHESTLQKESTGIVAKEPSLIANVDKAKAALNTAKENYKSQQGQYNQELQHALNLTQKINGARARINELSAIKEKSKPEIDEFIALPKYISQWSVDKKAAADRGKVAKDQMVVLQSAVNKAQEVFAKAGEEREKARKRRVTLDRTLIPEATAKTAEYKEFYRQATETRKRYEEAYKKNEEMIASLGEQITKDTEAIIASNTTLKDNQTKIATLQQLEKGKTAIAHRAQNKSAAYLEQVPEPTIEATKEALRELSTPHAPEDLYRVTSEAQDELGIESEYLTYAALTKTTKVNKNGDVEADIMVFNPQLGRYQKSEKPVYIHPNHIGEPAQFSGKQMERAQLAILLDQSSETDSDNIVKLARVQSQHKNKKSSHNAINNAGVEG